MRIMGYRQEELQRALEGLEQTGVPLVSINGPVYQASGNGDDIAMYYFVPQVARFCGLETALALDVFYYSLMALCTAAGVIGLLLYFRTTAARAVGLACLASTLAMVSVWNDIYLIAPLLVIAAVPPVLWVFSKPRSAVALIATGLAVGVAVSLSNLMRSHAGTGVGLFALLLGCTAAGLTWRQRVMYSAALLLGFAGPQGHFFYLVQQRDAFLAKHVEGYRPGGVQHAFWHPVYLGLGFLRNPYGLEWNDDVAMKAANSVSPGVEYLSTEYAEALKQASLDVFKRDRVFVYRTVFAKIGILGYYLLRYAGVGLVAMCFRPRDMRFNLAFAAGLGFSGLPGVIGIPDEIYLVGFMAFASMFSAASLGQSIDLAVLAIPHSRMTTTRWFATGPSAGPMLAMAASAVVVVVAVCIAEKKVNRTLQTVTRLVQESIDDLRAREILALTNAQRCELLHTAHDLPWKVISSEAQLERQADGLLLETDATGTGFQVEAPLAVDRLKGVCVTYDVEVLEGGITLGVLDQAGHWIRIANLAEPGRYQDQLAIYARDPSIKLVVANANVFGRSRCQLRTLNVALCDLAHETAIAAKPQPAAR